MAGMRLDKLAVILRASVDDDGLQARRGDPVEIGRAWVAQSQAAASEGAAMGQVAASVSCTFTLRAQGVGLTIRAADEIECDGLRWVVTGIEPVRDRRLRSVMARAKVSA